MDRTERVNIKAGDRVVLDSGAVQRSRIRIETVQKVTPTQIILTTGQRFRRSDGRPFGRGYASLWIQGVATTAQIAKYKRQQKAIADDLDARRGAAERIDAERGVLHSLFTRGHVRSDGIKWEVCFSDMTSAEVRELAKKVNA